MESILHELIFPACIKVLEIIGVTIIMIGVAKMLFQFFRGFISQVNFVQLITEIRIELGTYLVLCLEIFIGRDIIETLLNPSINDIIVLVILVILRTALAFFLSYEMSHIKMKQIGKLYKKNPAHK